MNIVLFTISSSSEFWKKKSVNGPRGSDLCETKIVSSSLKTLGNSLLENNKNIKKRKLEGEHFSGVVIKRLNLNLDDWTKQTDPDLGLNFDDQDN